MQKMLRPGPHWGAHGAPQTPYQIDLLYFILISFFPFSLHRAVVSALRALLHHPRLVRRILFTLHLYFELLGK